MTGINVFGQANIFILFIKETIYNKLNDEFSWDGAALLIKAFDN